MKYKWGGKLNYIEICSGSGRCINRQMGEEFNGTALSIIEHQAYVNLKKALFIDADEIVIKALNNRIKARGILNAKAILGNYFNDSDICMKIGKEITNDGLNLVFIDPTDCSIPFQLVRSIKKQLTNTDFIINLASMTDFNRNVCNAILNPGFSKSVKKYNQFLDNSDYLTNPENIELAELHKYEELRNKFRITYTDNLRKIGYKYFEFISVNKFYDILFATEHEKGLEFWRKATAIRFDGQRKLF